MEKKSIAEHQEFIAEKFTKRVMFKDGNQVVFVLNFEPGAALPAHNHPGATVTILGLEGSGVIRGGSEEAALAVGDVARLTGEEVLSYRADTRSSLYVTITNLPDERFAKDV